MRHPKEKDVTPDYSKIFEDRDKKRFSDFQEELHRFVYEHSSDYIDFYASKTNIFYIFSTKSEWLLEALCHASMLSRQDHNDPRHLWKIFKAIVKISAEISPKKYNKQKQSRIVRVSGLWKEAVNDLVPTQLMDPYDETSEKQQSLEYLKTFCQRNVYKKPEPIDYGRIFSELPVNAEAAFNAYFKNYPQREIWRLFYDMDKQKKQNTQGWVNYEAKDPGFFEGMCHAFVFLKKTISQSLTVDLFEKLHIECVKTMQRNNPSEVGPVRTYDIFFGVKDGYNTSLLGLVELLNSKYYKSKYFLIARDKNSYGMHCPADSDLRDVLQTMFEEYEHKIKDKAISPSERMEIIANLIGELIRIHPFGDGNCRVICILLLMRELMRNGFPPAMPDDPNRMMGYSREECVAEIINGINNFRFIKIFFKDFTWPSNLFGKKTDEIIQSLAEKPELIPYKEKWEEMLNLFKENGIGADAQTVSSLIELEF